MLLFNRSPLVTHRNSRRFPGQPMPGSTAALLMLVILVFQACNDPAPTPPAGAFSDGVFVVCEGVFGSASAQLDYLSRDGVLQSAVFAQANGGLPLGDVAQSMMADGDGYWLVVNNSATVHRLNGEDLVSEATFEDQASPRYTMPTSSGDAVLVTDLFAGQVAVSDRDGNLLRTLDANGGWTERMVRTADGRIWVADLGNNLLRMADAGATGWVDSVATGTEPEGLVVDANGRIWVLCTGGFFAPQPRLQAFDNSGTMVADFALDTLAGYPNNLELSPDGRTLYWISSQGLHRMAINAAAPDAGAWVPSAGANWYALGCDPQTGILYVGDARDFASAGRVSRYSSGGTLIDGFDVGISPGHFCFTQ